MKKKISKFITYLFGWNFVLRRKWTHSFDQEQRTTRAFEIWMWSWTGNVQLWAMKPTENSQKRNSSMLIGSHRRRIVESDWNLHTMHWAIFPYLYTILMTWSIYFQFIELEIIINRRRPRRRRRLIHSSEVTEYQNKQTHAKFDENISIEFPEQSHEFYAKHFNIQNQINGEFVRYLRSKIKS